MVDAPIECRIKLGIVSLLYARGIMFSSAANSSITPKKVSSTHKNHHGTDSKITTHFLYRILNVKKFNSFETANVSRNAITNVVENLSMNKSMKSFKIASNYKSFSYFIDIRIIL